MKQPITVRVIRIGDEPDGTEAASQAAPSAGPTLESEWTAERPIIVPSAGIGDELGESRAASQMPPNAAAVPFYDKAGRREPSRALNKSTEASNDIDCLDWSASEMEAAREARVIDYGEYLARRNRIQRRRT